MLKVRRTDYRTMKYPDDTPEWGKYTYDILQTEDESGSLCEYKTLPSWLMALEEATPACMRKRGAIFHKMPCQTANLPSWIKWA